MTTTKRRLPLGGLALPAALLSAAPAQAFPALPVTWAVPSAAGGVADTTARLVAQKAGAQLGQPVAVENRPGAGGTGGMEQVSRAAPDGTN